MTSSDIDGVICAICGIPKVFIKFMPHYDVDCRSRACNRVQFYPNMSSLPQPRKCPTIVDIEEHCVCCYYECMTNRIQNVVDVVVSNVVFFRTLLLRIPSHGISSGQVVSDWTASIIELRVGFVPIAKNGV